MPAETPAHRTKADRVLDLAWQAVEAESRTDRNLPWPTDPCSGKPDLGSGVEEVGENRDRLVLKPGVGIEKEYLVGRHRAGGELAQDQIVAAPEAVVDVLEMQNDPLGPAAFGMYGGNVRRVLSGRGVIDEMHLDAAAAVIAGKHAFHRSHSKLRSAVVDDDHGDVGRPGDGRHSCPPRLRPAVAATPGR